MNINKVGNAANVDRVKYQFARKCSHFLFISFIIDLFTYQIICFYLKYLIFV